MVKTKTMKNGKYSVGIKGIAMSMNRDCPIKTRFVIRDLLAAKI